TKAADGSFSWTDYAWTGADGSYAVYGLEPGTYRLWFYDYNGEFINEFYNDKASLETADDLVYAGVTLEGINAALARKTPVLSGTATDADTGEPVQGVWAKLYKRNALGDYDFFQCFTTDALGRYWFYGLSAGDYKIRFLDESTDLGQYQERYYLNAENLESASVVTYNGTTPLAGLDQTLSAAAPCITGTVTDEASPTAAPAAGVWVKAYKKVGESWDWATYVCTSDDGSYTLFGLEPGTYRLRFYDPEKRFVEEYYDDASTLDGATDVVYTGTKLEGIDAALTYAPRLDGENRYSTAVEIAKEGFPGWEGVDTVVIASGDDRAAADPLAASGLCWLYDAPLLLV
ncbi:MAG: hypothetical protein FDZ75_08860, partial [Actinobacteria bacterium]